jgi:hypothetical protein
MAGLSNMLRLRVFDPSKCGSLMRSLNSSALHTLRSNVVRDAQASRARAGGNNTSARQAQPQRRAPAAGLMAPDAPSMHDRLAWFGVPQNAADECVRIYNMPPAARQMQLVLARDQHGVAYPAQDISLATIHASVGDVVVTAAIAHVARSANAHFAAPTRFSSVESDLFNYLSFTREQDNPRWVRGAPFPGELEMPLPSVFNAEFLFAPICIDNHYSLLIIDHRRNVVYVVDSLGIHEAARVSNITRQMLAHLGWLRNSPGYTPLDYSGMVIHNLNQSIPTACIQADIISCGPFTFAYAYWFAFHNGRLPTTAQFRGPNAPYIFRLALVHFLCVAGAMAAPLQPIP